MCQFIFMNKNYIRLILFIGKSMTPHNNISEVCGHDVHCYGGVLAELEVLGGSMGEYCKNGSCVPGN